MFLIIPRSESFKILVPFFTADSASSQILSMPLFKAIMPSCIDINVEIVFV